VQIANGRTQGTRVPLPTKVTKRGLDCVLGFDWGRYRVKCGEVDTVLDDGVDIDFNIYTDFFPGTKFRDLATEKKELRILRRSSGKNPQIRII
jgi:hypothetical protein